MKDFENNSQIFPFDLDKNTKTQIWAFVVPLIMAANCILIRVYLEMQSEKQCGSSGGFSFDLYSTYGPSFAELLFLSDLQCADVISQFLYKLSNILFFISIGLSVMLPGILHLRHRSVKQTKLFE